jgi:thiamine-phosphate pyrophosphorylase
VVSKALARPKPSPFKNAINALAMISLPRLYAILDRSCFSDSEQMLKAAEEWIRAGVILLQYRNKAADAGVMLAEARGLHERCSRAGAPAPHGQIRLMMNDRADLCLAAEFDGVHVGQDDLSPESARKIVGTGRWVGVSTHNERQVAEAEKTSADYIAIGPVFATASKQNPDPVVGLPGVRRARELTGKPMVAIGGITRQNCGSVIEAGADAVAVISDLVRDPGKSVEEFLRILG